MDVTVSELMANFLDSPLAVWVKTFGPLGAGSEDKLSMFIDLVDGVFLHKIMTHIDPSPANQRVHKHVNNDVNLRIQNLNVIIRHIKNYYQEVLQQLIVMNLPNVLTIGKDPLSGKSMEEMKRLLLLILGCAVQCERKEEFIERIKSLDLETQTAIVAHIQEVTHNQENVLDLHWLELDNLQAEELDSLSRNMAIQLRKLIDQRDKCAEVIVELTQERDYLQSQQLPTLPQTSGSENPVEGGPITLLCKEDRQHLAVELADSKAKLRRLRQELEEKTEQLVDAKSEMNRLNLETQKLKQENLQLQADARSMRAYRDELDALRERAGRVDRLETELARCKERLHDVHFYKARVEELREDNLTLMETKAMLEEQLTGARGRCDKLHEAEKENLQLRSKLHDMEMERDADRKRIEELTEENMVLEISQKQSMNESAHLGWELEQLSKSNDTSETRKSFVLELNESASSRLLKLEKENRSLQSTIQELQEAAQNMEGHRCALDLEKENQGLSKKLERLQMLLDQEKQATQDMENLGEELLKDKQKLQKTLETVQADKERQVLELEQEKEHLSQAVTSLRKRAQVDSEARVREVEKENRILHQTISDTGSKLARLEVEKRQATKELEQLREQGERATELEREVARLERARDQLQKQVAALRISCEKAGALEHENSNLELDNRRLKKLADTAQNTSLRLAALEKEHNQLEEENLELHRKVEALKVASAKLAQLQQENKDLEHEREVLARSMEELRALGKKSERLEINCSSLDAENQRLQQCLDSGGARVQELERELQEAEAESQQLRRDVEELRIAGRRLEGLEKEKQMLELELGQSQKEQKQMEKEARRLRQQLEVKEAALEEGNLLLASQEKDATAMTKELSRLREAAGKVKELEWENKELQKQATIDKKTLATLREDLVNEKLKVQQQWNELEKLSHELEKIGLNREKLLQEEHSCEDSKYKILETKIDSTLKKTLEIREEKIQGLESRLEESSNLNQQLRTELSSVKKTLEALRQRQEEEALSQCSEHGQLQLGQDKWEIGQREATAELLKLKDRLIDVEKNNAALHTEKLLLKEQLRQLASQNTQLNAQILALQRQAAALQEHSTALQTQTAKLQVENSTLSSQSASLMAQNATLQGQVRALESETEDLQRQREEAQAGRESVLQDHERLLAVHERQATEYEQLISQHTDLKGSYRALELEHRALENKYAGLLSQKAAMEELESTLSKVRASLGEVMEKNTLTQRENESLKGKMDRLMQTHEQLKKEYDGVQLQSKELKSSLNAAQRELNQWQARYDELKEQHQGLDISLTKLDNHCELLTRLKGNLEEENHHLLSQIQMLSQQNQILLERTMESKELFHEEQKQYIDKLNSLRRQKEKLEEKIMDQYKFYDPTPKKRNHWPGAKALAKLIKPKNSRERVRSAPDIPLPATPTPDYPDGPPPLPPPPLPPRQFRRSLEAAGCHSPNDSQAHSPALTPTHASKVLHDGGGSKGRDSPRTPGSTESVNGPEESRRRGVEPRAKACSPSTTAGHTPNSSSRLSHRPKDDNLRPQTPDTVFVSAAHRRTDYRSNSAEFSRNTSSSDSPVHSRGSLDCVPGCPNDDVIAPGHRMTGSPTVLTCEVSLSSRSRSSTLPYDTPPQHRGLRLGRPSSPGSEMVTLEQFLQESSTPSPEMVQNSSREDLIADYFIKVGERPGASHLVAPRDGGKTPTSYVTPTVKGMLPGDFREGKSPKPGQSVKPNIRLPEMAVTSGQSHTMLNRGGSRAEGPPSPLQHASPRAVSNSLSRTFSLASADLLRSSGPDGYQKGEGSVPRPLNEQNQGDLVVRRTVSKGQDRPLSARLAGSLPLTGEMGYQSLDSRRLSLAPPKEEYALSPQLPPPLHHSSSLSLFTSPIQIERRSSGQAGVPRAGQHPGRPVSQHRGEVAMVTPVRAVAALKQEENEEFEQLRHTNSTPMKKQEGSGGNCSTKESPKIPPSSPDPGNDPQTVWYEYGCV